MKKIIILSAATLVLSSCGIYNKYKPVSEVPEGLYGSETVAATDTANFETSRGKRCLPIHIYRISLIRLWYATPICRLLICV